MARRDANFVGGVRRAAAELKGATRRQFMKRLIEFANQHELQIKLVYYPPYHSKYNMIERCWGILEKHGNGT